MSASYEITIESVEARTVRARVLLLNFQYPEAPTNKCFALQILADAHHALRDSHEDTNKKKSDAEKLAARADARLVVYSEELEAKHDEAFAARLIESAEGEIERVVELSNANFEKAAEWHAKNDAGAQELAPFHSLGLTQVLEFDVADARLLDHLEIGLRWKTWMSARDERY